MAAVDVQAPAGAGKGAHSHPKPPAASMKRSKSKVEKPKDEGWVAFEEYGSFAGPPMRPIGHEVGTTSLLLTWEAPQHLGGSDFEVLGYKICVRYCGSGDFSVHTDNTGDNQVQHVVEQLKPDTWHEFQVAAITAAGVGALSQASRPILTEQAPPLLRALDAATARLLAFRERLKRKQEELLMLARSGTMALRQQQLLLEGSLASAYRGDSKETQPPQPQQTGMAGLGADQSRTNEEWDADWGAADGPNEGRAASMRRHTATLSADETRQSVRRRKQLERHVEALKRRLLEQEQRVASLEEEQRQAIEGRREQLRETARRMRDGDSSDSPEVRPTAPRSWGITRAATRLITTQSPAKRLEALRRKQASEVCQASGLCVCFMIFARRWHLCSSRPAPACCRLPICTQSSLSSPANCPPLCRFLLRARSRRPTCGSWETTTKQSS